MSTGPSNKPAVVTAEAEVIDFEVVDESGRPAGSGHNGGPDLAGFAAQGPGMIIQAFRAMLAEKLKRWFVRSLLWGGALGLLATEHKWARVAFTLWALVAVTHLAFLVFGWYAAGKQGAKLAQIFGGPAAPDRQ